MNTNTMISIVSIARDLLDRYGECAPLVVEKWLNKSLEREDENGAAMWRSVQRILPGLRASRQSNDPIRREDAPWASDGALCRLAERCLCEPASRRLDGEIYCTIHDIADANPLDTEESVAAREAGFVFVEHYLGDGLSWIQAPPYTSQRK